MDSATIVAASLSDKELRNSVSKLVDYFDDQMKIMAASTNITVNSIQKKLESLKNIKIDSGGTADGGSSRRTSSLKQEEQQVKSVATSYDGLAKAQQTAIGSRGGSALRKDIDEAANSYSGLIQQIERTQAKFDISPIQNLRMRQHELEAGMQTAANEAAKAKKDVDELNAAISNYRATLETLPKNGQGFSNRQAIQKEINDLITLRDVSSAEQQKWEAASRQLASQYEVVKNEIRQIGQALIAAEESEKHVTTELDKQLQKINEISSRKTATQTYRDAISMETNSLEKAESKLAVLQALKTKILNTDLLSKKDTESLTSYISYTTALVERMRSKTAKSTKDDEDAIRKAAEAEKKWADNIVARGQIAQETSRKLIRMLNEEAQAGGKGLMGIYKIDGKDVSAVKELEKAIKDMQMQYNQMSDMDKDSAIGRALKRDIENAKIASGVISGYNKAASGVFNRTSDSESFKIRNYETLKNVLKELTNQYNQVSIAEIKAGNANHIIDAIQRTSREAQQLQSIMNRPTSFASAMKLSEKTLDDLSYKIRQLQSYKLGIDLQNPNAANEIKQVDEAILKLQKDLDKYLSKSKDVLNSNNALGRSWNYMKNRLAFYFTVGASTQFVKNLIEIRSQYEMNERALGILINSAERGTQIFNELSQMALVSPYTLIELSAAAKQLTAYDIAARDVVDTTRRLADMASAVGVPIERLTYALGQIKAYGYLNSRDARMFANAGIPLVKQLSDYYTELEGKMVSTADVYDRMKKKAIDYNSVMAVVTKMTDEGGKFFDFQAKMADTLKVRLANLTLAWNNMLNDMGKESQGVLTWGIGALRQLFLHWKQLDNAIKDAAWILGIRTGFMLIAYAALKAGSALGITTRQMALSSVVGTKLAGVLGTLGRSIATIAKSPLTWWTLLALAAWDIFDAFVNANKATEDFNKSLRDSAKTTYEDLKKFAEQYKNVRDSLYTTQKTAIGNFYTGKAAVTVYANQTVGQDISASEAKKVWEAMREQIELSSHASDEYISKLLSIENVSERLRQGFQILDDIQTVSAALKDIGDDGIKVTQGWSAWWNAWQGADGLIQNLKDLQKELQRLKDTGSDPDDKFVKVIDKDYHTALERFRKDLKVTTDSVIDFINLNGWSGDTGKIDEAFKQVTDRLVTQSNLDPQTAFTLQKDVEIARAKAAKEALEIRIADEKKALETASDEISKQQIQKNLETLEQQKRDFNKFNGENRAYWNDFTKYIKERHISELTAAYNSMTDHGKKAMDFQSDEWQKRVHDWANRYEKSHNLATDSVFNRLRNWINDANTWSVFIKMTISTEDGKSVYKQLEEYDKAADDAWKTMQRLDKRISQLRKKGAKEVEGAETGLIDLSRVSADDKELTEALKERTQAQKDYNNAVEKGGESKKENAAASKAQKQAESELQKALKDELQLIDKVRSQYKKLTDAGATDGEALAMVTNQFANSLAHVNSVLGKNGIQLFDITKFAGTDNPHALLDMLKLQLDSAKIAKNIKPEEIKELEVKYSDIKVDAEAYDLTKITKGLNNELDRLKDEYELAVSLDADPELGNMFADWMGIDMENLPRTAQEYANEASKVLNKELKELGANVELPNLLSITDDDMRAFEQNKILTQAQLELVKKRVSESREFYRKETDDRIKDWDKLLEKYAEYETKVNRIHDDAVKERVTFAQQFGGEGDKSLALQLQAQILAATDPQEKQKLIEQLKELVKNIAGDDASKINIATAIDNSETRGVAGAGFEQFQKSPEWIAATGDLAGMTTKAIGYLISSLEKYKKTAKNLDPKQIKQINSALKSLHRQQRQGNPFLQIADAIDRAKERSKEFQPEMDKIMSQIISIENKIGKGKATKEQEKELKSLKERWKELATQGEVSATEYVDAINASVAAASQAVQMFGEMAEALGGKGMTEAAQTMKNVVGILEKAGQGAAMGAQIGGGWGALIGGVAGGLAGVVTTFADQWSGNKSITEQIKESAKAVKNIEVAYKQLQRAVDEAFDATVIGASEAAKANKELLLTELKRQLVLEQERSSKHRDEDRISDLRGQIIDLEHELEDATEETLNNLLGISSHGDFFDDLISGMVDAFKKGEDAMKVFEEKWSDMIDNMIVKMIISQVLTTWIKQLEAGAEKIIQSKTDDYAKQLSDMQTHMEEMQTMDAGDMMKWMYENRKETFYELLERNGGDIKSFEAHMKLPNGYSLWFNQAWDSGLLQKMADDYFKGLTSSMKEINSNMESASVDALDELIDYYSQAGNDFKAEYKDILMEKLGEYWTFGQDSTKNQLSALQQGIQGITETTAGALEAYMNSVSQQVYYHSTLLEQIRDAIVGADSDIQLGVQGQMLLQLQNNYIIMQSIQSMMEGWTTPSGQGIRVELIS